MKLFLFLAASALAQDVDVCKDNCESRHEGRILNYDQFSLSNLGRSRLHRNHPHPLWRTIKVRDSGTNDVAVRRLSESRFWTHLKAELARCEGDERCINHANDMFRRCLQDCDNGGSGPPSCTDNCDRRLQEGSTVFRKRCHYEISSEKSKNAFVSWQSQYILAFYCPD